MCISHVFPSIKLLQEAFQMASRACLIFEISGSLSISYQENAGLLIWPPSANQLSCSILCTSLSLGAAFSQIQCYEF